MNSSHDKKFHYETDLIPQFKKPPRSEPVGQIQV
jgi:hypothetical protein